MNPQTTIELASSAHRDRQLGAGTSIRAGASAQAGTPAPGRLRARVGAALVSWGTRLGETTQHSARRLTPTVAR